MLPPSNFGGEGACPRWVAKRPLKKTNDFERQARNGSVIRMNAGEVILAAVLMMMMMIGSKQQCSADQPSVQTKPLLRHQFELVHRQVAAHQ